MESREECFVDLWEDLKDFSDFKEEGRRIESFFDSGFQFSRGHLLFLSIFLEDVPQVFVTFMVEDVLKEGGTISDISSAAQLNLLIALFDIGHKIAESWDSREDVGKTGGGIRTLRSHTDKVASLLAMGGAKFLSSSSDGTLKLWDAATGKFIRTIKDDCRGMAKIDETTNS